MGFLRDLIIRIRGDKTQLDSTLAGAKTSVNSFGNVVRKIGGLIGVAFGIRAIVNFTKEAVRLAAEAEGVKNAFAKMGGDSQRVLEDMKRATRGVIDESDLMALVIKAQNFKIPLQDLGKYLEFATNRAITMGKSISDFAELMIIALGRGSGASRSLIQMGLSTKEVNEALKDTQGLMKLVNKETEQMGSISDTASVMMGRLATTWKNFKEALGERIISSEWFQNLLTGLQKLADMLGGPKSEGINDPYAAWRNATKEEAVNLKKQVEEQIEYFKTLGVQGRASLQFWEDGLKVINERLGYVPPPESTGGILRGKPVTPITIGIPATKPYKPDTEATRMAAGLIGAIPRPGLQAPRQTEADITAAKAVNDMIAWNDSLQEQFDIMQNLIQSAKMMAVDGISQLIEGIGEAFAGGGEGLGRELLLAFANFMSQFGQMLMASGLGMMLLNPAKGTAMMAAGAAMLLTSGLIRGSMNKETKDARPGGYGSAVPATQTVKVEVQGKILGKDIALALRRSE